MPIIYDPRRNPYGSLGPSPQTTRSIDRLRGASGYGSQGMAGVNPYGSLGPSPDRVRGAKRRQPLTLDQQARRAMAAIYDPLIAQMTEQIQGRTKAAQDAMAGYTRDVSGQLASFGPSAGQVYGGAQQSQSAADAALAQRLEGQGSQLANELSGKLSAINAPSNVASEIVGGALQRGTGAANAGFARGTADLSRLIAQGANAQEYALKLPGVAGLSGMQQIGRIGFEGQQELAERTAAMRADMAAATLDERNRLVSRQDAIRSEKDKRRQELLDRQWEAAALKQAYGMPLSEREKRLLANYGSSPQAVQTAGDERFEAQDDQRAADLQAQKAAHQRALEELKQANREALEAKKAAHRSKLEADKARYRKALERQKAAKAKVKETKKKSGSAADSLFGD